MKNSNVLTLISLGVLTTTTHTLNGKDAYNAYKFIKAIHDAYMEIKNSEKYFLDNSEDSNEHRKRFNEFRSELYSSDVELKGFRPLSYDSWRLLQSENKANKFNNGEVDVYGGYASILLEGILWEAPNFIE